MAVSFDLFGTLIEVDRPTSPAAAVGQELDERGVDVPEDWSEAYREAHIDVPPGAELPLPAHVSAALASRGIDAGGNTARRAVVAAFDPAVETRAGAPEAVAAARDVAPVGICSNCSVPELARRALIRSELDRDAFDAVVTSIASGWRKPDHRAFEAIARKLDVEVTEVIHVGDDPETDGGIDDAGGRSILLDDCPLAALADQLPADESSPGRCP